jgi:D-sedoheptulose 7-phosphate isomerase/D-glycero-D-manno-heptose 1,7-bisphosphate phosphatase
LRPTFPNRRHPSAGDYFDQYATELATALASIDRAQLDAAIAILTGAHERDATIFCCGNGGSASIANHMVCDHQKGVSCDTSLRPRVISLSSNVEVMTAVTNDIGFADVFAFPLRIHGRKGDVLVAVSSSGKSENIIRALKAAAEVGMETIALTGFDGGDSRKLAQATIHVDGWNYGVIEDAHQACMHVLAQYLRHWAMPEELLSKRRF